MTDFPSQAPTPELAAMFPTRLLNAEKLVYDYLTGFATNVTEDGVPAINDPRAGAPPITVIRGWPSFPGHVPAVGVAAGTETEDQQHDTAATQFAGTAYAHDETGEAIGTAEYYAEPLYSPIIVQLVHENRDERDRLHQELWRILVPLRRLWPSLDQEGLIRRVRVDSEKAEGETGPEVSDEPMIAYLSIFTVHVYHEMLDARNVAGADSVIDAVNVTVSAADTGS